MKRNLTPRPGRCGVEAVESRLLFSTYTVTNVNDSGAGSMRQAMISADAHGGVDNIHFDIGGASKTITPLSPLPQIEQKVVIDGTTQPGYAAGKPVVELNGVSAGTGANGLLVFHASGSTIKGLVINRFDGYGIFDVSFGGCTFQGNFIGTNVAGNADLGNARGGINVFTSNDTIGGTTVAQRNVISGNGDSDHRDLSGNGVQTQGSARTTIKGNYIGVGADGVTPIPNSSAGVLLSEDGSVVTGNVIAYNGGPGVHVAPGGTGDRISRNSIFGNTGIGIDLRTPQSALPDGVTANDALDADVGSNDLQNTPTLTSVTTTNDVTTVTGTLGSEANKPYTIELFLSDLGEPSPQGKTFLQSTVVTTDGSGTASFSLTLSAAQSLGAITATATDPANNTSEFSPVVQLTVPPLRGTVFNDVNEDGVMGAGEVGLADWYVYLDRNKNNALDRRDRVALTDANGNYRLAVLTAGVQRLRLVPRDGYRQTTPGTNGFAVNPSSVPAGSRFRFGFTSRNLVRGVLYTDVNANGVFDAGDTPRAGYTVYVDADNDGTFDAGEQSRVVGTTGAYRFNRLLRGRYVLRVVMPAGAVPIVPAGGVLAVRLGRGGYLSNRNFGFAA